MAMSVTAKVSQGFGAGIVGWSTPPHHGQQSQICHKTSRAAGLSAYSLFHYPCLLLFTELLASFQKNNLLWARISLSHLPPPTLHLYFRSYWIALYSKETPYKCHMFIHDHTLSILQARWQTDKAKPCVFEPTWMLLPQVECREWVTAFARRT